MSTATEVVKAVEWLDRNAPRLMGWYRYIVGAFKRQEPKG